MEFNDKFALKFKPLEVRPLKMQSLTSGGISLGSGTLPDSSGQPEATFSEKQEFKRESKKYVEPSVISHLKSHKEDILHGSQSLVRLLPHYSREPKDFDVYSKKDKKTAQTIESKIDKKFGKNVVATKPQNVPNFSGREDPTTSGSLFRIVPVGGGWTQDAYVDIMKTPKKISTTRKGGITHESLIDARKKAEKRIIKQPLKGYKARSDVKDIDKFLSKRMKDTDRDGVPDRFDCNPTNPNEQGRIHDLWMGIKKRVTGKDYAEQEEEYEAGKPEEGGLKETAYDIKRAVRDVAVGTGEVVVEGAKRTGRGIQKAGEMVGEYVESREEQWGKNIHEGLRVKKRVPKPPTIRIQIGGAREQQRELERQYQRQLAIQGAQGIQAERYPLSLEQYEQALQMGYTPEQLETAGFYTKEDKPRRGYSQNRSRFYQEQSVFGRGVVPYRPISYRQCSVGREEAFAPNPMKNTMTRPRGFAVAFSPPFIRLAYRRRVPYEETR